VSDHGVSTVGVARPGLLVINADDWGQDVVTTDRILDCVRAGSVSTASAMVFMADSERASHLAPDMEIGLHLNLTTPFSGPNTPPRLIEHQKRVAGYLLGHRLAQVMFHPGLVQSFDFLVRSQLDEFLRLYGAAPRKIDGHHHFHLSTNVILQRLLPAGAVVRRNFHFERHEKGLINRTYRMAVDQLIARRHRLVDFFFALPAASDQRRLRRIAELGSRFVVEVEVHPVVQSEYDSLEAFTHLGSSIRPLVASVAAARTLVRSMTNTGPSARK